MADQMSLSAIRDWLIQNHPAAGMQPPAQQGWDVNLPTISLQTMGMGRPQMGMDVNVPAFGGVVGAGGSYQPASTQMPASWTGGLSFKKSF